MDSDAWADMRRRLCCTYRIASAPPSKSYGREAHIGPVEPSAAALDKTRRQVGKAKNKDDFDERCYP